mgnify:CR=1 FL=1
MCVCACVLNKEQTEQCVCVCVYVCVCVILCRDEESAWQLVEGEGDAWGPPPHEGPEGPRGPVSLHPVPHRPAALSPAAPRSPSRPLPQPHPVPLLSIIACNQLMPLPVLRLFPLGLVKFGLEFTTPQRHTPMATPQPPPPTPPPSPPHTQRHALVPTGSLSAQATPAVWCRLASSASKLSLAHLAWV